MVRENNLRKTLQDTQGPEMLTTLAGVPTAHNSPPRILRRFFLSLLVFNALLWKQGLPLIYGKGRTLDEFYVVISVCSMFLSLFCISLSFRPNPFDLCLGLFFGFTEDLFFLLSAALLLLQLPLFACLRLFLSLALRTLFFQARRFSLFRWPHTPDQKFHRRSPIS